MDSERGKGDGKCHLCIPCVKQLTFSNVDSDATCPTSTRTSSCPMGL